MTIKEVAEIAGVSTTTVSNVINNTKNVTPETRRRVEEAVKHSGYRPNFIAKSLRERKTNTIGVLVEDIRGFSAPGIVNGISEYADKHNFHILLNDLKFKSYGQIMQYKDKIDEALSLLLHGIQVDAIIYVSISVRDITEIFDSKIKKPLVFAFATSTNSSVYTITYDNENISAQIIRYLFDLGHSDIGIITGPTHTPQVHSRMRGVQRVFKENNRILDSALVKNGDWGYGSGYACMTALLSQNRRPTAVFAMNDPMAAGAMDASKELGLRIPADISIVGFDNHEMSAFLNPRLTTVEIDFNGIGYRAAEIAIGKINNTYKGKRNHVLPSRLVIRNSASTLSF